MKQFLMKTLTDKKGRIASFVVGLAVAFAVRSLAQHNITIDSDTLNEITLAVTAVVGWGIDAVVLHINASGVKQIQEALPSEIKVDGVAGQKTVEAVQDLTNQPQ